MFYLQICSWLDLNSGLLVLGATALQIEPQSLSKYLLLLLDFNKMYLALSNFKGNIFLLYTYLH